MLTPDQLDELRRLDAEGTGRARCKFRDRIEKLAFELLRAAEVLAACERWGVGAVRGSDGRWGPRLRTSEEQDTFWCSRPMDYDGYATFADAVVAAAKWLEEREAAEAAKEEL